MADTRLSDAFHVLRELVHLSSGWVAPEPRLEVKIVLVDHIRDDARSVARIVERGVLAPPREELNRLLGRANGCESSAEYLEVAYGELKPALIQMAHEDLRTVDPHGDEPRLRLSTILLHDQERHVSELGTRQRHTPPAAGTATVARDRYLDPLPDPHDGPCALVHDLLAAELCAAERAARLSHDQPELPWDKHVERADEAWAAMRAVQACDRLLTEELGCRWGLHTVATDIDPAELERRRAAAAPILEPVDWWHTYLSETTLQEASA